MGGADSTNLQLVCFSVPRHTVVQSGLERCGGSAGAEPPPLPTASDDALQTPEFTEACLPRREQPPRRTVVLSSGCGLGQGQGQWSQAARLCSSHVVVQLLSGAPGPPQPRRATERSGLRWNKDLRRALQKSFGPERDAEITGEERKQWLDGSVAVAARFTDADADLSLSPE